MNMKKNITIIVLFALLLSSCKKDIGYTFPGQSTNNASADLLISELAGTYNVLEASEMYGWGQWGLFAAGNDEAYANNINGTSSLALVESLRSSASDASYLNLWKDLWFGVERANTALYVINQPAMDSTLRRNIKGQLLFLRAYYYYLLVNNYGDVPYRTYPASTMGTNLAIPETPSKQIYDSIIKDMTAADTMVQTLTQARTTTVVTQTAVEGILARVCMSAAGYPVNGGKPYYQKSLYWSQKVINSGVHGLYATPIATTNPTPAYARIFINNMANNTVDNNKGEAMWDAAFLSNGANASGSSTNSSYTVTQLLGVNLGIPCPSPTSKCNAYYHPYPSFYYQFGAGDQRKDWALANYVLDSNSQQLKGWGIKFKLTQAYYTSKIPLDSSKIAGKWVYRYDTTYYGSGGFNSNVFVNPATGFIDSVSVLNGGSGYYFTAPASLNTTKYNFTKSAFSWGSNSLYLIGLSNLPTTVNFVNDPSGAITSISLAGGGAVVSVYDHAVAKWRREYESANTHNPSFTACNFPIIRYADVLLMAAEADLQVNGGTSNGVEWYNQVKRRAYGFSPNAIGSPVDVSAVTLDSIIAERSRELCFEGSRRNDLKRWGLSVYTAQLTKALNSVNSYGIIPSGLVPSGAFNPAIQQFLSNPQKYILFPIPAQELLLNPNLTQNYGW